jgi:hypothetical protein
MLTDEERSLILKVLRSYDGSTPIYDFILFQLNTGLRPSETLLLRESDINLGQGLLRLPTSKTGDGRWTRLNDTAQIVIWRHWHGDGGYLFRTNTGSAFDLDNMRRKWRMLLKPCGIKGRIYDCRHDFLSRAALKGLPLPVLKALAGHQTLAMVDRYAHLQPEYLDRAVRMLEIPDVRDNPVTMTGIPPGENRTELVEKTGAGEWNRTTDLRFTNQWQGVAQVLEGSGNPRTGSNMKHFAIRSPLFRFGSYPAQFVAFLNTYLTPGN